MKMFMRCSSWWIIAVLIIFISVSCTGSRSSSNLPQFQYGNDTASQLARESEHMRPEIIKAMRRRDQAIKNQKVGRRLLTSSSVGLSADPVEGRVLPTFRINLLELLSRDDSINENTALLSQARSSHASEVDSRMVDIKKLRLRHASARKLYQLALKLDKDTKALHEQGERSEADLLKSATSVSEAKAQYEEAKASLSLAQRELKRYVGE